MLFGGLRRQLARALIGGVNGRSPSRRVVHAKYDAAQTSVENKRHWANADHLSASASLSAEVRRTLRSRARYEVANNGYARGMVNTLANYVIGTGPRLQLLTDDAEVNRAVEREFARWALAIGLAQKLWTMRVSQAESGEVFGILTHNPGLLTPTGLDLKVIEADQVATPLGVATGLIGTDAEQAVIDGIRFDPYGNPSAYYVLKHHPGDTTAWTSVTDEYNEVDAESVIHLFRPERPGQHRGVPEVTSSLSLYALLRRYSLAVVTAAEQAALPGGVIYSDASPEFEEDTSADPAPMDEVELERGIWLTMPKSWKLGQVKAEQPTTMYGEFKRELLNETARPINMPFNVAAGNSSGYNYASGRLDHQAFFKAIRIDQGHVSRIVLDRLLGAWIEEAVRVEGGYLPASTIGVLGENGEMPPHQWFWDGFEHVDPVKEANAQATRLKSHTTTLAAEYARQGLDWENELRQRAKEMALIRELKLDGSTADGERKNSTTGASGDDGNEKSNATDKTEESDAKSKQSTAAA